MLCEQPTELRNCHQLGFVPNSHQSRTSLSDFRKLNDESLPICLRTKGMLKSLDLPLVVPHGLMAQSAALEIVARVKAGVIGNLRLVEMECT